MVALEDPAEPVLPLLPESAAAAVQGLGVDVDPPHAALTAGADVVVCVCVVDEPVVDRRLARPPRFLPDGGG